MNITSRLLVAGLAGLSLLGTAQGQTQATTTKTFIDYFQPVPITSALSKDVWGAPAVGPRDPQNGLEDVTMKHWNYWDGQIIKAQDGKYHLFASRWEQARGHNGWGGSKAVHAVSDKLTGPYVDTGLCWPDNQGGKGHNVTALALPDGRYAVVISETRPGTVFVSKSLDVVQGPSIYPKINGLPKEGLNHFEDPVVWFSGGKYHIVVNNWSARRAFHLTSPDGIKVWKYQGLAYDPTKDFVRYTDGTVNRWNKLERPSVYLENGHVAAVTLAVIDVPKDEEKGNDNHGSKVIVIPFDGAGLDGDLQ